MKLGLITSLAGGVILTFSANAEETIAENARQAFAAQHWEEVTAGLEKQQLTPELQSLLALAYYHQHDLERALPLLQQSLAEYPDNEALSRALLDTLVARRDFAAAKAALGRLQQRHSDDYFTLVEARIAMAEDRPAQIRRLYEGLLDVDNATLAQRAAGEYIQYLQLKGNAQRAYEVAQKALQRNPDSFLSYRFRRITPAAAGRRKPWRAGFGYRLEYDDNLALLPDSLSLFGSQDEEDFRHVFTGDLVYRKSLPRQWRLFAEGHASQSLHHDNSEFNFTRVNAVLGLGQSFQRWGWRLPLDYSHERYDGDEFRNLLSVTPGVYFKVGEGLYLHFYGRLQEADYDQVLFPQDDRSGDAVTYGVLLAGTIGPRWKLRSYLEQGDYDSDGSNWQRDERKAYFYAEYAFNAKLDLGGGFRYAEMEFDQLNVPFFLIRDDQARDFFLSLNYKFDGGWQARFQATRVDHESNIPLFEYDRSVLTLGLSKEF